jgi:hypothetical protein
MRAESEPWLVPMRIARFSRLHFSTSGVNTSLQHRQGGRAAQSWHHVRHARRGKAPHTAYAGQRCRAQTGSIHFSSLPGSSKSSSTHGRATPRSPQSSRTHKTYRM